MGRPTVMILDDPDRVVHTLSAFRRLILSALDQPGSATGIARRLGSTRQKVNYHLRALEDAGLVEVEETRQRRGLTERVMRRTSDVVLVDPTAFDTSGLTKQEVAGLSAVVATATDLIGHAAEITTVAGSRGERVAAGTLDTEVRVSSPAELKQMLDEIARVVARHDGGDEGLRIRVVTSVLPARIDR